MSKAPALWSDIKAPTWEPNRTAWLLTCVDLTSLLVGFFVLLFSTQTLKTEKWDALAGSFQAQFAGKDGKAAQPVVPDGIDNAVIRVTGARSGLGYLDALFHQRLEGDGVWGQLVAETGGQGGADELRYGVPATVATGEDREAWVRLGGAVRHWKNPIGVRVYAQPGQEADAAKAAVMLANLLSDQGVAGAFAEVKRGDGMKTELVVRAR